MKKGNEENIVIDEDSLLGPKAQKTDFYKNLPREICLHGKTKDFYPFLEIKKEFKKRGININFDGAKYLFKWNQLIIETFFPLADILGIDPLVFTDEKFSKYMEIIQVSFNKNQRDIKQIDKIKSNIVSKIDNEVGTSFKSIVVE